VILSDFRILSLDWYSMEKDWITKIKKKTPRYLNEEPSFICSSKTMSEISDACNIFIYHIETQAIIYPFILKIWKKSDF